MRIGYDGKRMFKNFTGLGNYSRYILSLVSRALPEAENIIYSPIGPDEKVKKQLLSYPQNHIKVCLSFFHSAWRSFGIIKDLKKDQIDIFHGLSNELPFGIASSGIASVVTIHDLIFLRYPAYYSLIDRFIYTVKSRYACRYANQIIAVSEQTKSDIVHFFRISPDKIDVVYQDCAQVFKRQFSEAERSTIKAKYSLPEKFILNVGTIEPRKNLLLAVKALRLLPEPIKLLVIGKEKAYASEVKRYIKDQGLDGRVVFLKHVSYDDLPGIYQQAYLFVYPSRFEGFGIPILEALYSQLPVIAATGSCLEEAGGPNSLYTDPDNYEQLATLIQDVLNNPEKRLQMIEAGNRHLANFRDEIIVQKLMSSYKKAIGNVTR